MTPRLQFRDGAERTSATVQRATRATLPIAVDGLPAKATREFTQQIVAAGAVAWRYTMQ